MRTERVSFHSEGELIQALLRLPERPAPGALPIVVQGPGWLGLKDAKLYERYHEAFTAAGMAVLVFDYRGFGESGGDPSYVSPAEQVADWRNAVEYAIGRPDLDRHRLALFGSGGTGGGNAICAAAGDRRVGAVIVQHAIADGEDWLHRMRREHEWVAFLERLREDRRRRISGGPSDLVDPRTEIMVATPERSETGVKKDVDHRVGSSVQLRSAEAILAYRPADVVHRLSAALMVVAVEPDAVTPYDHSVLLYERAPGPKRLVTQRETSHYRSYDDYHTVVTPLMVEWLREHLQGGPIEVREDGGDRARIYLGLQSREGPGSSPSEGRRGAADPGVASPAS